MGQLIIAVSQILDIFALGLASQATLSIATSFTMIFNALLAWKYLGEKIPVYKLVTIGVIVCGAVLAITFATYETHVYNSRVSHLIKGTSKIDISPYLSCVSLFIYCVFRNWIFSIL